MSVQQGNPIPTALPVPPQRPRIGPHRVQVKRLRGLGGWGGRTVDQLRDYPWRWWCRCCVQGGAVRSWDMAMACALSHIRNRHRH